MLLAVEPPNWLVNPPPLEFWARITNTNPWSLTGGWTLTIFAADGRQLGTLEGSANDVAPGQTVTVSLFSFDAYYPGPYRTTFQTDFSYDF